MCFPTSSGPAMGKDLVQKNMLACEQIVVSPDISTTLFWVLLSKRYSRTPHEAIVSHTSFWGQESAHMIQFVLRRGWDRMKSASGRTSSSALGSGADATERAGDACWLVRTGSVGA